MCRQSQTHDSIDLENVTSINLISSTFSGSMNNNYYVFVDKYDLIIKLQAAPYA